jgi:hypothetical protein
MYIDVNPQNVVPYFTQRTGFDPGSIRVRYVVDKVKVEVVLGGLRLTYQ